MKLAKRITCRQRLWLALAFMACVLQVLGLALPSLVVCYRTDRPPRVEFFSSSCSCRLEALHPGCQFDASGAPCLEASCTDLHLDSHPALTVAAPRHHAPGDLRQRLVAADRSAFGSAFLLLRLTSHRCGIAKMEGPPLVASFAASRLRC